jgi:protein-disulfide isomerase
MVYTVRAKESFMSKQFWAILAAIVIVLGGIFFFTGNKNDTGKTNNGGSSNAQPSNHVEGSKSTGVTLVEYGDYECPFCGEFAPVVQQVTEQYKDKIQFQFINLPLNQIHRNAFAAARAAEAADLQGKFWEMHDLLYKNQDPQGQSGWVASSTVLDDYFVGYARQAGVADINKFKTDFASRKVNDTINADLAKFKKTGLEESTPTFFLDGKHISPTLDPSSFTKAIDTEIKNKTGQ